MACALWLPAAAVYVLARPGVARRAGQHLAVEEGRADRVR